MAVAHDVPNLLHPVCASLRQRSCHIAVPAVLLLLLLISPDYLHLLKLRQFHHPVPRSVNETAPRHKLRRHRKETRNQKQPVIHDSRPPPLLMLLNELMPATVVKC